MDAKINSARDALVLIANTYTSAINEINAKQDELKNKINNM